MPKDFLLLSASTLSPLAYSTHFIYLFCERTMSKLCKVWGQPEASQVDRPLCYQFCHWFCTNSCSEKNARLMRQSKPPTPHPLSRNGEKKVLKKKSKKVKDEMKKAQSVQCLAQRLTAHSFVQCLARRLTAHSFVQRLAPCLRGFMLSSGYQVTVLWGKLASIFMPSFWHNVKLHYQCVYTTRLRFWH